MINTRLIYKQYKKDKGVLDFSVFKNVIERFHKKITDKIISTGYEWQLPYYGGLIKVIQLERKIRIKENGQLVANVDWGASLKLKADIIERGDVPYKAIKDSDGKVIGNNGGEQWLVYSTLPTYFCWVWVPNIFLKNCFRYSFDITWSNSKKLSASITDKSYLLFKLRERNGSSKDYLKSRLDAKSANQL